MKIAIVTSLNKQLYDYYAFRFLQTYNWPFDCYIYHEGWIPEIDPMRDNIFYRDINETNPSLKQFIERNAKRNQYSTEKNEEDEFMIDVNCDSRFEKEKILSLILDVFDFDLESFREKIHGYNLIDDITHQDKIKPYLVQDLLEHVIII